MTYITALLPKNWVLPDNPAAMFLRKKILSNKYIDIDYWSFLHFMAGWVVAYAIEWLSNQLERPIAQFHRHCLALAIIIIFEIIEFGFTGSLILEETLTNVLWDIIIGYLGFIAVNHGIMQD